MKPVCENDNTLRSHNFSPFFQFSIYYRLLYIFLNKIYKKKKKKKKIKKIKKNKTSTHTRYSYGHHEVFHAMTVFLMCLIHIFLPKYQFTIM